MTTAAPYTPSPAELAGIFATPQSASMLTDVAELLVIHWARSGRVRSEVKAGHLVVAVDDVAREAAR